MKNKFLVILKPNVANDFALTIKAVKELKKIFGNNIPNYFGGGNVSGANYVIFNKKAAEEFYKDLLGKLDLEKFGKITRFLCRTRVPVLVFESEKSYKEIKSIFGTIKKEPGTLREKFSKDGDESFENSFHCSESEEEFNREVEIINSLLEEPLIERDYE